jgi:thiol-disulfide isomerase/thioredoxin
MNPVIKSVSYDLLIGVVLMLAVSVVGLGSNFQITFLSVMLLFLLGGFIRGNSQLGNMWLDTILLNVPILPVAIIFGLENRIIFLFPAAALIFSFLGLLARSRWMSRSPFLRYSIMGVSAVAAVFLGTAALSHLTASNSSDINFRAPEFKIAAPDGSVLASSSESPGKIIVMDFWASWCRPCQLEFPYIQRVYGKYKDNPDVELVAVNSGSGDTMEKARAFMDDQSYTVPMAFDDGKLSDLFKIEALPTLIVIDKNGDIRFSRRGFDPSDDLVQTLSTQIDKLLVEK